MPCNIGAAKEVCSTYQSHTTILVPNFTSALIAALAQVLPHLGVLRSEELDRRDPQLVRGIAVRLIEEYAAMLNKRGLPITPGSLYLAYFAGPAGAVKLLSSPNDADATSLMANADATGRTTRENWSMLIHSSRC